MLYLQDNLLIRTLLSSWCRPFCWGTRGCLFRPLRFCTICSFERLDWSVVDCCSSVLQFNWWKKIINVIKSHWGTAHFFSSASRWSLCFSSKNFPVMQTKILKNYQEFTRQLRTAERHPRSFEFPSLSLESPFRIHSTNSGWQEEGIRCWRRKCLFS